MKKIIIWRKKDIPGIKEAMGGRFNIRLLSDNGDIIWTISIKTKKYHQSVLTDRSEVSKSFEMYRHCGGYHSLLQLLLLQLQQIPGFLNVVQGFSVLCLVACAYTLTNDENTSVINLL